MEKKPRKQRFAICISPDGCDDLDLWKLYRVLPDKVAAEEDFLRIIDDSGEDYLYPTSRFVVVNLPQTVVNKLLTTRTSHGA